MTSPEPGAPDAFLCKRLDSCPVLMKHCRHSWPVLTMQRKIPMKSRYAQLTRAELAVLVPELLLIGHLIDRSGMPWCVSAFGHGEMTQIAIEQWAGASPVYTKRMQRALRFEGNDVPTIFKGMQLDVGAPPQFMDFRYSVKDRWHGEFHLNHCGALMDVEPMGPDYVRAMCHDIEDPTFAATAVATNPRAQMRPLHRPPRLPGDRHPHCAWTVIIDESYPPAEERPALATVQNSRVARLELADIDRTQAGAGDYSGPLLSDIDFGGFSHSALVRIADEVCIQMHLLALSFQHAVRQRATGEAQVNDIVTKQLTGVAGIAAERIMRALGLAADASGALRVLELHPLLNPAAYVSAHLGDGVLSVAPSPAHEDDAWVVRCGPGTVKPLRSIVQCVSPILDVEVSGTSDSWALRVVCRDEPANELGEVAITRFSGGASFVFQNRRSIPLTPVSS